MWEKAETSKKELQFNFDEMLNVASGQTEAYRKAEASKKRLLEAVEEHYFTPVYVYKMPTKYDPKELRYNVERDKKLYAIAEEEGR